MLSERHLAEKGLAQAVDRLADRIQHGIENEHLIPFGEALQWTYSLHEYHRNSDAEFLTRTSTGSPVGETFRAMIYARGLLTHGMADVTRLTGRRPIRIGISPIGASDGIDSAGIRVHWADFAALPAPGKPEKHDRDALYRQHLERQRLLDPFGPVLAWLRTLP